MRKALSYLLLVSYAIVLLKPVLPILTDFIAHAFYKYEHIATVHKENGKTHLHYELQKASEETGNDKSNLPTKAATEVSPHVFTNMLYTFDVAKVSLQHFTINTSYPPAIAIAGIFPPPKA